MAASTLTVRDRSYEIFRLDPAAKRLPYTLRILLENALRHGEEASAQAVLGWSPAPKEIPAAWYMSDDAYLPGSDW